MGNLQKLSLENRAALASISDALIELSGLPGESRDVRAILGNIEVTLAGIGVSTI